MNELRHKCTESGISKYLHRNRIAYKTGSTLHTIPKRISYIVVLFFLTLTENTVAQSQQTVEGAQSFLSQVVAEKQIKTTVYIQKVNAQAKWIKRTPSSWTGTCKITEEWESQDQVQLVQNVTSILSGTSNNPGDVCVTRINGIDWDLELLSVIKSTCSNSRNTIGLQAWYDVDPNKIPMPIIHWSNATIEKNTFFYTGASGGVRSASNVPEYISVQYTDPILGNVRLDFGVKDMHLRNRIEYAMEFLKLNCDMKAGTGF